MTGHVSDRVIDRDLIWRPGRGGVRAITCWVAECAECGSEWAENHEPDHGGVPHFAPADISRYLLDPDHFGFRIAGDGRVLCRDCARALACAAAGHEHTPWHPMPGEPGVQVRHCEHCGGDFQERHTDTGADVADYDDETTVGGGRR